MGKFPLISFDNLFANRYCQFTIISAALQPATTTRSFTWTQSAN